MNNQKSIKGGYRPGSGVPPVLADIVAADELAFLDAVWRDTSLPLGHRLRAADMLAKHLRLAEANQGKKGQRQEAAAETSASGRFVVVEPPRLVSSRKVTPE